MPLTSETLNEEHREIREESRAESAGEQSPASGAAAADELARLTEENARLQAAQRETERRERVARLLEEARLPPALRTATFERLCFAADDAGLAELLRMRGEDARALTPSGKPVCVEQRGPRPFSPAVDAASFAAALR